MAAVFSEIEIGGQVIGNRVVHASSDNRRAPWGIPSQLARKFYTERSQGNSLTISEPVGVEYGAGTSLFAPLIASSEQIAAWKAIVDLIHQSSGKFYIQLFHPGRSTTKGVLLRNQVYYYDKLTPSSFEDTETVGPSTTTPEIELNDEWCDKSSIPRELTTEEIARIIESFAISSHNAKLAGADGVEVNAGGNSLIGQFLDPLSNFRSDKYAESLQLLKEIISALSGIFPGRVGVYLDREVDLSSLGTKIAYLRLPFGTILPSKQYPVIWSLPDHSLVGEALNTGQAVSFSDHFISNPSLRQLLEQGKPIEPFKKLAYGQSHGAPNYISFGSQLPSPSYEFEPKRVAIIGAGPSGISSARAFLKFPHHQIDIFEQRDKAGGIWAKRNEKDFSDSEDLRQPRKSLQIPHGHFPLKLPSNSRANYSESPVYPGLVTNVPQQIMFGFTAFKQDVQEGSPFFISGEEVAERVNNSIKPYEKYIHFNTSVEDVKNHGSEDHPKFRIITRQKVNESDDLWDEKDYDFLIVAVGHNWEPRVPDVPGLDKFPGKLIHSAHYRGPTPFRNKKVLVVGTRESGLDIKDQLRTVASKIFLAQRSEHPYGRSVESKGVELRSSLIRVAGNSVYFSDTDAGETVDAIILATGYRFHFPFLQNLDRRHPESHKKVPYSSPGGAHYIPGIFEHTFDIYSKHIAFVGPPTGTPSFTAWEKQAFVAALVFNKLAKLPSRKLMEHWEAERLSRPGGQRNAHSLLSLSDRTLFLENLNLIASDYLNRPEAIDDELLRDWPREWTRILFDSVSFKKKQYENR